MVDIAAMQERVWTNKVAKGFNTTNVEREFNYTYAELAEAYDAWRKGHANLGAELADVTLFVMSLAKMTGVDLEAALLDKMDTNEKRVYQAHNGHHIKVADGEK